MNRIHFLKAIWSDIILLEQDQSYAMIDTGYESQKEEIILYLKERNIKKLDFIFITHFHRDHYGSLKELLNKFHIDKVYIKAYSGFDGKTADGNIADNDYRKKEMKRYQDLIQEIKNKSQLIEITEQINKITWKNMVLNLYNINNKLQTIFEDKNHPYYHQYKISENYNSCAVLLQYQNKKIYLASDLTDYPNEEKDLTMCNCKIAKKIGHINIYKSAHHGLDNCNSKQTLDILTPDITVTTNTKDYIKNISTYLSNTHSKVFSTENETIIINLDTMEIRAYKN